MLARAVLRVSERKKRSNFALSLIVLLDCNL